MFICINFKNKTIVFIIIKKGGGGGGGVKSVTKRGIYFFKDKKVQNDLKCKICIMAGFLFIRSNHSESIDIHIEK